MTLGSDPHFDLKAATAKALAVHRSGRVLEAAAAYRELLDACPGDANLTGLLAMTALQQGDEREAERLWRIALASDPPVAVLLRDLNNLVATLLEQGRAPDAVAICDHHQDVAWRDNVAPDGPTLRGARSLAVALRDLGKPAAARKLLESVSVWLGDDLDSLRLLLELRVETGARSLIDDEVAEAARRCDTQALTTLWTCASESGERDLAARIADQLIALAPVFTIGRARRGRVLVLNGTQFHGATTPFDLHFSGNYPRQLAERLGDEFEFVSVFATTSEGQRAALSMHADAVVNNVVNAEALRGWEPGAFDAFAGFVDSLKPSVINHPRAAAACTRQVLAQRLRDVPGLVVPDCIRFLSSRATAPALAARLCERLGLPLVLRTTAAQRGAGMIRLDTVADLAAELARRDGEELYGHNFIDNRGPDGLYRKIRVAIVGDQLFPVRVDYSPHWMVHGRIPPERQEFYRHNRRLLDEERRILEAPNDVLTSSVLDVLHALRGHASLDVFGVDFDVTPDGRVLFFEANANMLLLALPCDGDVQHPPGPDARLLAGLRARLAAD